MSQFLTHPAIDGELKIDVDCRLRKSAYSAAIKIVRELYEYYPRRGMMLIEIVDSVLEACDSRNLQLEITFFNFSYIKETETENFADLIYALTRSTRVSVRTFPEFIEN